jgi:hypothetical protein
MFPTGNYGKAHLIEKEESVPVLNTAPRTYVGESGGGAPRILGHGTGWRQVVNFKPPSVYLSPPREPAPDVQWTRWPKKQYGRVERR